MSYVDRHLAGQERVVFRTRLHPIIFGNAVGFAAFVIFAATMITLHNELAPATVRLVCLGAGATQLAQLGDRILELPQQRVDIRWRHVTLEHAFE